MLENTISLIHVYEQQCVFLLTFMRLLLIYTGQCVLQNHHWRLPGCHGPQISKLTEQRDDIKAADKIERLPRAICTSLHSPFFPISVSFSYWLANLVRGPPWDSAASAWQLYLLARARWQPRSGRTRACLCVSTRVYSVSCMCVSYVGASTEVAGVGGRAGGEGGVSFSVALAQEQDWDTSTS